MPCHAQLRWTFPFLSILILKEFRKNYVSRFMFNLSWILPRRSKTDRGCRTSEDEVQRSRKSLHSQTAVPRRPCHAPTRVLYHALKRSFHSGGQKRKKKKKKEVFDGCSLNTQSYSDLPPEWQHPCGASIHPNGCKSCLHLSSNCP